MARDFDTTFNLLTPIQKPKTAWDRIYDWVLLRARFVLLLVEILIVVGFFAKVFVDNTGKNREQEFDRLQLELVTLENNFEDEFIDIQGLGNDYGALWNNASNVSTVLQEIYSYVPNIPDSFSVQVDGNTVSILGYNNLDNLQVLESRMKESPTFSSTTVQLNAEQRDIEEDAGQLSLVAVIDDNALLRTQL